MATFILPPRLHCNLDFLPHPDQLMIKLLMENSSEVSWVCNIEWFHHAGVILFFGLFLQCFSAKRTNPCLHHRSIKQHAGVSEADHLHLGVLAVIDWQSASREAVEVSDKLTLQPRVFFTRVVWHRSAVPLSANNKKLHAARHFSNPKSHEEAASKSLFWNRHQI